MADRAKDNVVDRGGTENPSWRPRLRLDGPFSDLWQFAIEQEEEKLLEVEVEMDMGHQESRRNVQCCWALILRSMAKLQS